MKLLSLMDEDMFREKRFILYALLVMLCMIYLTPYIVNHHYLEAQAHNDDGMYAYYAVRANPANFTQDIFSRVHEFFINSSLTYFGSFWIVDATGIPLRYVYFFLLAIMFFAMPFIYVHLVKDKLPSAWLPIIFLVILLSKYYSWNLSNHNDVDFPYRADISVPFLFGGMLLSMKKRSVGYALLGVGGLFHPAMALFALTTVLILQLFSTDHRKLSHAILLIAAGIVTLIPSVTLLFSGQYTHVPKDDVVKLLMSNMHFLPWESPYLWKESVLSVSAFGVLLICCSFNTLDRLGGDYKKLVIATIASTAIWMALHIIGLYLRLPSLIMLSGLRSVSLLAVVTMPILLLYLIGKTGDSSLFIKVLGYFALAVMAIGKPYGLFLSVSFLLFLREVTLRYPIYRHARAYVFSFSIIAAAFLLSIAITAFSTETAVPFAKRLMSAIGGVVNIITLDKAPTSSGVASKYLTRLFIVFAVISLFDHKYKKNASIFALAAVVGLFFLADTARFYQRSGSTQSRDLYEAQLWARNHTSGSDLFIVYGGSWRSFSERPAFVPRKLGYYMYKPDVRIKHYDDLVFHFYGIQDPYGTYSQKELIELIQDRYASLKETDFIRLARVVGAKYLVEERQLSLPLAYRNGHYNIYYVGA